MLELNVTIETKHFTGAANCLGVGLAVINISVENCLNNNVEMVDLLLAKCVLLWSAFFFCLDPSVCYFTGKSLRLFCWFLNRCFLPPHWNMKKINQPNLMEKVDKQRKLIKIEEKKSRKRNSPRPQPSWSLSSSYQQCWIVWNVYNNNTWDWMLQT